MRPERIRKPMGLELRLGPNDFRRSRCRRMRLSKKPMIERKARSAGPKMMVPLLRCGRPVAPGWLRSAMLVAFFGVVSDGSLGWRFVNRKI